MGTVGHTSLPGPPAWVLEPHLDISVGNVMAVQELDGCTNITHDLCSFCRHRGGGSDASQRSGSLVPPCFPRDNTRWRQQSCNPGAPIPYACPRYPDFLWECPRPPGPLSSGLGYLSPAQLLISTRSSGAPSQGHRQPISNEVSQTHGTPWGRDTLPQPLWFSWED